MYFAVKLVVIIKHIIVMPNHGCCCVDITGDRYCSLLVTEGGLDILHQILNCPTTHPQAVEIAADVLHMVSVKFPKSVVGK